MTTMMSSTRVSLAQFIASLNPRVAVDAMGLTPGLLASWPNTGSAGPLTAAGSLRPTAVGGTEVAFSGAQRMESPAFAMGARSSGAVVCRVTAINQGVFQFAVLNTHCSVLTQNTGTGDKLRVRTTPAVEALDPTTFPRSAVVAWAWDNSGGIALFNGVTYSIGANIVAATTSVLAVGDLTGGIFPLTGAIHQLVMVDAVLTSSKLAALSAGLRAKWGI